MMNFLLHLAALGCFGLAVYHSLLYLDATRRTAGGAPDTPVVPLPERPTVHLVIRGVGCLAAAMVCLAIARG